MTNQIATQEPRLAPDIVHSLVLDGDLGRMSPDQRVAYYVHRCQALGIDPGEQPFQLVKLNGKLVLYATKTCANALTRVNRLSVEIKSTKIEGSLVIVEARATGPDGRFADDIGALDLNDEGRLGKPNALMKCATKAKRRAVLSLVGLGVLDETEVESIRGAQRVSLDVQTGAVDAEIVEPAQAPEPDIGPRCGQTDDGADLAEAVRMLVEEYAEGCGALPREIWPATLRAAGLDLGKYPKGTLGGPVTLTIPDAKLVKAFVEGKLLELAEETLADERAGAVAGAFNGSVESEVQP